ncbi:MAG TPA: hypothetical protein VFX76_05960, partial [Roseiflexaceae bacterium]|nr:hypothetical protein [Roseiflexaceae bacterium]
MHKTGDVSSLYYTAWRSASPGTFDRSGEQMCVSAKFYDIANIRLTWAMRLAVYNQGSEKIGFS